MVWNISICLVLVEFRSSVPGRRKKRARTNFFPIHLNGFFIYLHRNCTTARFTEQLHFNFPNCYYFSMLVFPKSWHTQIAAACKDDGKVVTVSLLLLSVELQTKWNWVMNFRKISEKCVQKRGKLSNRDYEFLLPDTISHWVVSWLVYHSFLVLL